LSRLFATSAPQSICLVRLSAIGDTCHALAVARNLRDNWPDARITWIIGKTEAGLMGDIDDLEFIIFDKTKGRDAYDDISRAVAGRSFDVALCMHASMRVNPLYRRLPARLRLGFDFRRARDFQWLFTNRRIPAGQKEHALDAMMGFARSIGAEPTPLRWDIPQSDEHRVFAARFVSHPTLVISPCSSQREGNYRNWPAERFAAVARHAQEQHGCRIVLTGGSTPLERDYGTQILAATGADIVDLIGQTTLKQTLAVLAAADALLCPDSGPVHMATAVQTPVIGLYASSNPERTGPYVSRQLTVNRYPEALSRFEGRSVDTVRWGRRVRDPAAMALISVDDVIEKIDAAFGTPPS
jgi:heptosyltransferase I